ncbi:MAG: ADP-glyceromanno-heptose 6-epimerase [Bdellovibrionales bacterium]|nr:ADP-glyceromanno-heptose 6-epimerase [Bdellovibrionales bacterium]
MIIVTGAAGFIGYQLARELSKKGNAVIGVDEVLFFETRAEHQDLILSEKLAPDAILDREFFLKKKAKGTPVTAVFHMGACSDTTETRVDYLTRVNVEYSKQLWNLCTEFGIPFIYASSAATYGAGEAGYSDDEALMASLKPLNPYGNSKLQFDLWAIEQSKQGHEPPAWSGFKFFNVYGFGERHKGRQSSVVLQGFDQILSTGKIKLFRSHKAGIADGEQKRDFIFVGDVVSAMVHAFEMPIRRGIFNLGTGKARSFLDLAKATFSALGIPVNVEFIDTPVQIRDQYQYFTEAKMEKLKAAGYTREFAPLENGVAETIRELKSRFR